MSAYNSIKNCADPEYINPETGKQNKEYCYSLVDAICKHHDWDYYEAEQNGNNATMIMNADMHLLDTIKSMSQTLQATGTASYICVTNGINDLYIYIGQFDSTESTYIRLLVPAFAIKLGLWDAAKSVFSEAISAFKSIWNIFGTTNTTYTDPTDPSKITRVQEQSNGAIVYESENGRTDTGWALDPNAEKAYTLASVTYGADSIKPESTFAYLGNGRYQVNGGAGIDKIVVSNDLVHLAQLVLEGGDGVDTYKIPYGICHYEINDTVDNHILKADASGKYLEIPTLYKEANNTYWSTIDGTTTATHASPWTITFEDGSTITLADGSDPGDFGINLLNTPTDPTTTLTISGDLTPTSNPPQYDVLGNVIVDPNSSSPGRNDTLFGSAGNDRIEGKGGSDIVYGQGGNDWILGGDGRDGISTGNGSDIIEGGTEGDLLFGGAGDDQLFGENKGDMDDLVVVGDSAPVINEQGDLVSGQDGNDFIYGSNANDALFGGAGRKDSVWRLAWSVEFLNALGSAKRCVQNANQARGMV